ncbi:response regulator transcription factor [Agromyces italicus]|uniref:response regulator transcription factor n=1 Tax=Agromyces italicus TaxID=279572 RepID=UPI0003B38FCE|nr:response regulator transcription factor [Agromyces italicus]
MHHDRNDVRAVVVSPRRLMRIALSNLLRAQGIGSVGEAAGYTEAIIAADADRAQLVVVDLELSTEHGAGFLHELRATGGNPGVLALHRGAAPGETGRDHGILLLDPDAAPAELASAVHTLCAGRSAHRLPRLTPRQLEVLALVAKGYSNDEIRRELAIGLPTVKQHVRDILARLGARTRIEAVYRARASGVVV